MAKKGRCPVSKVSLFSVAASVVTMGLVLTGCATSGQMADETDHMIMCPGCETVWGRELSRQGARGRRYHVTREMACETCDKMAKSYYEGDQLVLHDCPTCKVKPQVLTERRSTSHLGHKHQ
jgi:Zn finger protein HypA/HybF involved in hydrogenase expression